MRYDFSVIIPYYADIFNNVFILSHINELKKYQKCEIIIIETGNSASNIKRIDGIKYIFAYSNTYNYSWLVNLGIYNSTTDNIFVTDFRYNQKIELYHDIYTKYKDNKDVGAIFLTSNLYKIDKARAIGLDNTPINKENLENIQSYPSMGQMYYKKHQLVNIGGYDESVFGDSVHKIQSLKVSKFIQHGRNTNGDTFFYNLNIPVVDETIIDSSLKYSSKIEEKSDKLLEYVRANVRNVGNPNKYSKEKNAALEKIII